MGLPRPDFGREKAHRAEGRVAVGVDEVGRGCLAGPVVTAAVVLPEHCFGPQRGGWWRGLNDSKLVAPEERERLSLLIHREAHVQISWCTVEEIDRWNILHATMIAMRRALAPFRGLARTVLVDGHIDPFNPRYRCEPGEARRFGFEQVETIVKGDQRSFSIAAASIVAKVYRDAWMREFGTIFPGYGFETHRGYSTPQHYEAIDRLGACALHRRSFAPFKVEMPEWIRPGVTLANSSFDGEDNDARDHERQGADRGTSGPEAAGGRGLPSDRE